LFDVFIISPPGMNAATKASGKGGLGGSFFSGIFAVLLATPCSAPMLGTALGFAFSQPPLMIFAFFLLIGLGLALPFILLGLNPRLMKIIPKPGEWMNIFKEVMGFLLLGTAIWLLHVIYQQNGGDYLLQVLIYLLFLGLATWMYGRFVRLEHSKSTQWIFTILAMLVIAASAWIFLPYHEIKAINTTENVSAEKGFEGWQVFSPELVDELVAKDEPVFIDFGAKWCMTCQSNEKLVTTTAEMKKAFADKKVNLIRGDFTKKNPVMQDFMQKFGRAGVPFYVLYVPGKEPVVFPEIITIPMLKQALEEIK
jgi:thiol:disulfide interchange protein DsbD